MDTTVKALQNLYVAMGGDLDDVENLVTIPAMINAIAALVDSGATKELPKVTSSDNGKLLTVSAGKWTKAEAPTELPAVTAADNGKVLKVVDGAWDKGTDLIE